MFVSARDEDLETIKNGKLANKNTEKEKLFVPEREI